MSKSDQGRHIHELRQRARRPRPKAERTRQNAKRKAIKEAS